MRRLVRCWRWADGLLADLEHVLYTAPVQHIRRDWHASRRARRLVDERIAAFRALEMPFWLERAEAAARSLA